MIRMLLFFLLSAPVFAQTRCDTLAHDIEIHRQITAIQTRTIAGLQKQVRDLSQRTTLADQAIADLERRASAEVASLNRQYAGYVKPPTKWQRFRQDARTFVAGAGTGMLLLIISTR